MSWIALKMLTGDRAKFLGIVLGLTFAALLITQQGAIFCGLMLRTSGQITDITGADLWVMDANVQYVDDVKPMIENNLYRVRGVEGVLWAVPLYKGNARAKLNSLQVRDDPLTGKRKGTQHKVIEQVILLGLDDATLVGAPPTDRVLAGDRSHLRRPEAVMVDATRLRKLYPGEDWEAINATLGPDKLRGKPVAKVDPEVLDRLRESYGRVPVEYDERIKGERVNVYKLFLGRPLEMNDHRAVIVAVCEATRTFQSNAVVYTTYSRTKQFVPLERKPLTYILAKTDGRKRDATGTPVYTPEVVAELITKRTGLKACTSEKFKWETIEYFMKYTGIPFNFGITTVLGFLVGTAIAGQTFYNFTIENLKQFGSLKAMGTTNLRIVGMILLQALVVGLLGYGLGVGLAAFFGYMTTGGELAFHMPWILLPITGGAVVLICVISSVLSVRRVIVLEPAVVFRG